MLFSYQELINIANLKNKSIDDVCLALNNIGFEVEHYHQWVKPNNKVVTGKIIELVKHPKADRLFILKIDTKGKIHQVVTSAKVNLNDTIAFFLPGAKIGNQVLKPTVFFGVESNGMLCSINELGVNKEVIPNYWPDIMTFDEDTPLGVDAISYFGLDDYIIDVNILYNRSDAASYAILALELAAYFGSNLTIDDLLLPTNPTFTSKIQVKNGISNHLTMFEAKIEAGCKSNLETELLLMKSGNKPINVLVDLTALVALYWNQPSHVYDVKKIGKKISVGRTSGSATLLNNEQHKFKDQLCIIDEKGPICMAGIMGFESTAVDETTTEALFEFVNLDAKSVRINSNKIKVGSDSSIRFGRPMNKNVLLYAISFVQSQLGDYSKVINPLKTAITTMKISKNVINQYVNEAFFESIDAQKAKKQLNKLGFEFKSNQVVIPFYRNDLYSSADLVEELLRFIGFDIAGSNPPKILNATPANYPPKLEQILMGSGYSQVKTFSLVSPKEAEFNPLDFKKTLNLKIYTSEKRSVYRNSLIPSLVEVLEYNVKRKIPRVSIFEIAKVNGQDISVLGIASNYTCQMGIKKVVESVCQNYGEITYERSTYKDLHNGVSAFILVNKKRIGYVGKMHPRLTKFDFWIAEVNLETLNSMKKTTTFKPYFPNSYIVRDLTIEKKDFTYSAIELKLLKLQNIDIIKIVDSYNKDGKTFLTYRLFFTSDQDVNENIESFTL